MTTSAASLDLDFDINTSFNHQETIQTVIASMDPDKTAVVNQTNDTWKFRYGTVEVVVNITGEEPQDTFTVFASVLTYPIKDELTLLKFLLEKNAAETFEARFALQNDQVLVLSSRSVEDLSAAEISRIITVVAAIADEYDEELQAKFGG
ncbi:MAG: YbjN domain-containing protein [Pseudanabaenaceae cyanobacterium bins.68]|nr:YbjN domain-containing protein [Pseudanabaenaceae cyanobacterium bins.68]